MRAAEAETGTTAPARTSGHRTAQPGAGRPLRLTLVELAKEEVYCFALSLVLLVFVRKQITSFLWLQESYYFQSNVQSLTHYICFTL